MHPPAFASCCGCEAVAPGALAEHLRNLGLNFETHRSLVLWIRSKQRGRDLIEALLPDPVRTTADSVPVLRSIHLETPFRLDRQAQFHRRRYSVDILLLNHI